MNINDLGFPFTSDGGDRRYGSADFREYFDKLLDGGVIGDVGNELSVEPQAVPNKSIYVDTGAIFIKGAMRIVETTTTLSLSDNISGNLRIDRIVARINYTDKKIEFAVLEGTPGSSPSAPSLTRNATKWELSLAQIAVDNGYSSITVNEITDERGDVSLCGYFRYRAKPAWYPGGDVPVDAWLYTIFKEQLTVGEISDIEANSTLMDIINSSKILNISKCGTLIQEYKVAGTYTYTVPANVSALGVIIAGGGGGGGGGRANESTTRGHGGAGGGAGYVAYINRLEVIEGQEIPVVVGVGGVGGVANTVGSVGGTSSFNGIISLGGGGGPTGVVSNVGGGSPGVGSADGGYCILDDADASDGDNAGEGSGIDSISGLAANGAVDFFTGALYGAGGGGGSARAAYAPGAGGINVLGNGGAGGQGADAGSADAGASATGNIAGGGGGGTGYNITPGVGGDGAPGYIAIYQVM